MKFLLDTNIIIYWINSHQKVAAHIADLTTGDQVCFTYINAQELYFGAYNSSRIAENLQKVEGLFRDLQILNLTPESARCFGEVKTRLRKKGQPMSDIDLTIAAVALANDATLITNDEGLFEKIAGLKVANWTQ